MKKGFTLSELMIAMVTLGLICAAVIPAIVNTMPNQKRLMMKRAYYTTANIIEYMINNEDLYPPISSSGGYFSGFNNWEEVTFRGETHSGYAKFPNIFAGLLKTKEDVTVDGDTYTVYTTDGVKWTIETGTYSTTTSEGETVVEDDQYVATMLVDVNGDKQPNCYEGSTNCSSRTKDFDQFIMYIWMDGTIEVDSTQTWALDAINATSEITDTD